MKPPKIRWRMLLMGLAGVYALSLLLLVINETNLVYQPFSGTSDPAKAGLPGFTAKTLHVDGLPSIYYWENNPAHPPATVFYFHGNGGGLYMHTQLPDFLDKAGLHVIAMEYPSYPGAEGKPSEATIMAQANALWNATSSISDRQKRIIWGYSLGSGVAVQLAANHPPAALILEAPFTAVVDRAAELFPLFPIRRLMQNTYRSRDYIGRVEAPVLVLHGNADLIIPVQHGRTLFVLAKEPKTMNEYRGFGHLDLHSSGAYADALAFIAAKTK